MRSTSPVIRRSSVMDLRWVSIAVVAAVAGPGCFQGADISKIVCEDNNHCPIGYVCTFTQDKGSCQKPADSGGIDEIAFFDGNLGIEIAPGLDAANPIDRAIDQWAEGPDQAPPAQDVGMNSDEGGGSKVDGGNPEDVPLPNPDTRGSGETGVATETGDTTSSEVAGGNTCTIASQCNDGNPCTDDTCDASGHCQNTPNDANSCTALANGCLLAPHCLGGVCSGTFAADGTHCGSHSCVGLNWNTQTCLNGKCTGSALDTNCDDSNLCTNDSCNDVTGCPHTAVSCSSPDQCQTASCTPSSGCTYTAKICSPDACHTSATCNPSTGNCEQGTARTCVPDACHTSASCTLPNGCQQGASVTCVPDACHTSASCALPNGCQQGASVTCVPDACHTSATCTLGFGCQQGAAITCVPDACHTSASCTVPGGCQQGATVITGTLCPMGSIYGTCGGPTGQLWSQWQCSAAGNCELIESGTCVHNNCAPTTPGGCT